MKTKNYLLSALAFLFFCAPSVSVKLLTDTQYKPNSSDKIDIFTNFNTIPYKFDQINNIEENHKTIGNVNYQTELQDTMKLEKRNNSWKIVTGIFCGLAGIVVVAVIFLAIGLPMQRFN